MQLNTSYNEKSKRKISQPTKQNARKDGCGSTRGGLEGVIREREFGSRFGWGLSYLFANFFTLILVQE